MSACVDDKKDIAAAQKELRLIIENTAYSFMEGPYQALDIVGEPFTSWRNGRKHDESGKSDLAYLSLTAAVDAASKSLRALVDGKHVFVRRWPEIESVTLYQDLGLGGGGGVGAIGGGQGGGVGRSGSACTATVSRFRVGHTLWFTSWRLNAYTNKELAGRTVRTPANQETSETDCQEA